MFNTPDRRRPTFKGSIRWVLYVLLALAGVGVFGYVFYRIIVVLLGTVLQFWYRYTQNLVLLWLFSLLTLVLIGLFLYFLVVRRAEYLKGESGGITSFSDLSDSAGVSSSSGEFSDFDDFDDGWY